MPSSTSSFKTYQLERIIPRHNWAILALATLFLASLLIFSWELYCRNLGYAPTLNDTKDLWASRRVLIDKEPKRTVLIGASRMLFDFDMDVYEKEMGERPLQLATVGTNPGPYLEDLANHPNFSGTVIIGVVPGLFFAPGGPPMKSPLDHLKYFKDWSPSQKVGHYLGMFLERRFAFINQEDLTLNQLLLSLKVPNREKAKFHPELPPYFYTVDEERQGGMTDIAAQDLKLQKRIQQIWLPLFTPPPDKKKMSPSEKKAQIKKMADMVLKKTKKNVKKIVARGGKVIFIRLPSTGKLRELENKYTPRADYWDQILETTQSPGVHFEDFDQLKGFSCPEWSHLNKKDSTEFTKRLMLIFKTIRQNEVL
jgi:hypothetical protein